MVRTKITRNGQITIPKSVREELGITEGDYVDVYLVPDGILLKPKKALIVDIDEYPSASPFGGASIISED